MTVRHDGLSLRDPLVSVNAAREGIECAVDDLLLIVGQNSELLVGLHTLLVEYTFKLRADAFDLLQIIDVVRFDTCGAECCLANHPSARGKCGHVGCVDFGVGDVFFVLAVERCFELCDAVVRRVEVVANRKRSSQFAFEFSNSCVAIVEVAAVSVELCFEISNAALSPIEFVASGVERRLKFSRTSVAVVELGRYERCCSCTSFELTNAAVASADFGLSAGELSAKRVDLGVVIGQLCFQRFELGLGRGQFAGLGVERALQALCVLVGSSQVGAKLLCFAVELCVTGDRRLGLAEVTFERTDSPVSCLEILAELGFCGLRTAEVGREDLVRTHCCGELGLGRLLFGGQGGNSARECRTFVDRFVAGCSHGCEFGFGIATRSAELVPLSVGDNSTTPAPNKPTEDQADEKGQ